ncbi:hypothetical protein [Neptuniibacter sp. QD37_11]|uniref:hypothetical protein n=1 Tax=Neptuniibacter sp. QD37_11 TaxID=3398209 RepID=UPI0039F45BE3
MYQLNDIRDRLEETGLNRNFDVAGLACLEFAAHHQSVSSEEFMKYAGFWDADHYKYCIKKLSSEPLSWLTCNSNNLFKDYTISKAGIDAYHYISEGHKSNLFRQLNTLLQQQFGAGIQHLTPLIWIVRFAKSGTLTVNEASDIDGMTNSGAYKLIHKLIESNCIQEVPNSSTGMKEFCLTEKSVHILDQLSCI